MNMEQLVERAVRKARTLEVGTQFVVRELFDGVEWNGIAVGVRRKLGVHFRSYVNDHPDCGVVFLGKRANNSSEYLRVED